MKEILAALAGFEARIVATMAPLEAKVDALAKAVAERAGSGNGRRTMSHGFTFTANGDGTFAMKRSTGPASKPTNVRPFVHRRGKYLVWCGLCKKAIEDKATAYRETGETQLFQFLSSVRLCAKCVTGASS